MKDDYLTISIDRIDDLDGSKRGVSTDEEHLRRVGTPLLLVDRIVQGRQNLFPCQSMLEGGRDYAHLVTMAYSLLTATAYTTERTHKTASCTQSMSFPGGGLTVRSSAFNGACLVCLCCRYLRRVH